MPPAARARLPTAAATGRPLLVQSHEVLAHGETAAVLGESSEKHTLAFSAPSICPELVLTNRRFSKSEKGGLQWKHTKGVFSFAHCTLTLWC
eukprot:COSAG06_NODE_5069_length_3749_cov_9.249315_7_plen_91_part_01